MRTLNRNRLQRQQPWRGWPRKYSNSCKLPLSDGKNSRSPGNLEHFKPTGKARIVRGRRNVIETQLTVSAATSMMESHRLEPSCQLVLKLILGGGQENV